ncbi:hypothetical protein ACJX0J_036242 [Zea mays]
MDKLFQCLKGLLNMYLDASLSVSWSAFKINEGLLLNCLGFDQARIVTGESNKFLFVTCELRSHLAWSSTETPIKAPIQETPTPAIDAEVCFNTEILRMKN